MKPSIWLFAFAASMSATAMLAQDARRSDPCNALTDTDPVAAKNFLTFDKFDKELRVAITKQDAVALAFLVTFPLRVNDAGGTISLDDAAALKRHFQEVFTPAVRKEILSEKNEEVGCNDEGIGYARGVIWVNASKLGYAIWSVNPNWVPPYPKNYWDTPRIRYICQTQTHRIVVDTLAAGQLRYRAWNKPHAVTEAPDLEIKGGEGSGEGTGLCATPIYTFKNGPAVYRVEGGLRCFGVPPGDTPDPDDPPKEATGRLEVTIASKVPTDSWCY
jgi:hypothetical protein